MKERFVVRRRGNIPKRKQQALEFQMKRKWITGESLSAKVRTEKFPKPAENSTSLSFGSLP